MSKSQHNGKSKSSQNLVRKSSFYLSRLKNSQLRRASGKGISPESANNPPSRLQLLYESRDKKLCLIEDAQGHISVVRSDYLAKSQPHDGAGAEEG